MRSFIIGVFGEGIESLKTLKSDKRDYRVYMRRLKALPDDYRFVYKKIMEYLWGYFGGGNGHDVVTIHEGLLELFEAGAAEGKNVLEVTGDDVAAFSDELLRSMRTYLEDRRQKLNREIKKKLGK